MTHIPITVYEEIKIVWDNTEKEVKTIPTIKDFVLADEGIWIDDTPYLITVVNNANSKTL